MRSHTQYKVPVVVVSPSHNPGHTTARYTVRYNRTIKMTTGIQKVVLRHHVSSPMMNILKRLLVVGCVLGAGMAIGAIMVGHQAQDPHQAENDAAARSKRSAVPDDRENVVNRTPTPSGALYTRWGRSVCPPSATLVYKGVMASGHSGHTGGGVDYLCMVEDPEWDQNIAGANGYSYLYGVEFKAHNNLFKTDNAKAVVNHDGNCAVCRTTRSVQLLVPGKQTCMAGWTEEYHGYLMSSGHAEKGQRNYVCVDAAPEIDREGYRADGGGTLFPVEAQCGSLPCPNYVHNNEVTCVVCSQ